MALDVALSALAVSENEQDSTSDCAAFVLYIQEAVQPASSVWQNMDTNPLAFLQLCVIPALSR